MKEPLNAFQRVCFLMGCIAALTLRTAMPAHATDYPGPALLGEWYLDAMHGQSPAGPTWEAITINFAESETEAEEASSYSIFGNAGCNHYWLGLDTFSEPNTLTFLSGPVTTRMWCAGAMETEDSYLNTLLQVKSYAITQQVGYQRLIMYNDAQEAVLEFVSEPEFADTLMAKNIVRSNTIYLPLISTN